MALSYRGSGGGTNPWWSSLIATPTSTTTTSSTIGLAMAYRPHEETIPTLQLEQFHWKVSLGLFILGDFLESGAGDI